MDLLNDDDGRNKKTDGDHVSLLNAFGSGSNMRNRRSPPNTTPTTEFMSVDAFHPSSSASLMDNNNNNANHFIELETSPPHYGLMTVPQDDNDDLLGLGLEGLTTTSGLLLTHRQTPARPTPSTDRIPTKRTFELDWGFHGNSRDPRAPGGGGSMQRVKRLLSFAQVWIVAFCLILVIGTVTVWHSSHQEGKATTDTTLDEKMLSSSSNVIEQIILLPLPTTSNNTTTTTKYQKSSPLLGITKPRGIGRALRELRQEFDDWVATHEKKYHSHDETEHRFQIWSDNHATTEEKNERHGPCKMTKEPVFGSNMFKDLTTQEFQSRYLTGYKGPKTDELHHHHQRIQQTSPGSGMVLDATQRGGPLFAIDRHGSVQEKYETKWKENKQHRKLGFSASYSGGCKWYDVSCWLRLFVSKYGYRIGGTMEPAYDQNTYPSAVDWRDMGIVTDIHSQGNCGACWAITAVETIESAFAMSTGTLYDLAESEVIICDDTCDLCEGGWPQNAYEYVMSNKGLPLEDDMSYDGDYLLELTYAKNGQSDSYSYSTVMQNTCPSGGGGGSNDKNDNNNGGGGSRYGSISGYGYTTDRCICYTDGTGCDCDEQNERLAVQNVATYGPATVCLEASLWQDYTGGIMTADLGCSSAFIDMNHCVQAVGYAFTDSSDGDEENQGSGSGSGSQDNGGQREGYWIIRNQWSSSWGMYGYAFVAMGANTCGVLNDMTSVYMK